jgi:uncharacterized protein (DUF3084 family)
MIERMIARAEQLAQDAQQRRLQQVATQLRAIFGSAAIEVEEARVLVRGRGIVKRWLIDPSLRFLAGGLK